MMFDANDMKKRYELKLKSGGVTKFGAGMTLGSMIEQLGARYDIKHILNAEKHAIGVMGDIEQDIKMHDIEKMMHDEDYLHDTVFKGMQAGANVTETWGLLFVKTMRNLQDIKAIVNKMKDVKIEDIKELDKQMALFTEHLKMIRTYNLSLDAIAHERVAVGLAVKRRFMAKSSTLITYFQERMKLRSSFKAEGKLLKEKSVAELVNDIKKEILSMRYFMKRLFITYEVLGNTLIENKARILQARKNRDIPAAVAREFYDTSKFQLDQMKRYVEWVNLVINQLNAETNKASDEVHKLARRAA